MANSWDSFAVNFTNSFNNAQRQAAAREAETQSPFLENLMKEFETAKAAIAASNATASKYKTAATSIVGNMGISTDFSATDLENYTIGLLAANAGDEAKTSALLAEQLTSGALVTREDFLKKTQANAQVLTNPNLEVESSTPSLLSAEAEEQTDSMLQDEASPTPDTAASTPTNPNPSQGINVGKNLIDLSEAETPGFGETASKFYGSVFGGSEADQEYNDLLIQDATATFRTYLENSGQLELYNNIRTGKASIKPFNLQSAIVLDIEENAKPQAPEITTLTDADDIAAVRLAIENGLVRKPSDAYTTALDAAKEQFADFKYHPKNFSDISASQLVPLAALGNALVGTDDALPAPYLARLNIMAAAVDKTGRVTTEKLGQRVTSLFSVLTSATEGESEEEAAGNLAEFLNVQVPTVLDRISYGDENTETISRQFMGLKNRFTDMQSKLLKDNKPEQAALFDEVLTNIDGLLIQNSQAAFNTDPANMRNTTQIVVTAAPVAGQPESKTWTTMNARSKMNDKGVIEYLNSNNEVIPSSRVVPLTEEQLQARDTKANQLASDVKVYDSYRLNTQAFLTSLGRMDMLVSANPTLIENPVVNSALSLFSGIKRELSFGADIIDQLSNPNVEEQEAFQEAFSNALTSGSGLLLVGDQEIDVRQVASDLRAAQENAKVELSKDVVANQVAEFQLLQAEQILAVFDLGAAKGQTGMAMSNKDFDRLGQIIRPTRGQNATAWRMGLDNLGRQLIRQTDERYGDLLNDPRITTWEDSAGGVSFFGNGKGPKSLQSNFDNMSPAAQVFHTKLSGTRLPEATVRENTLAILKPGFLFGDTQHHGFIKAPPNMQLKGENLGHTVDKFWKTLVIDGEPVGVGAKQLSGEEGFKTLFGEDTYKLYLNRTQKETQ